MKIVKAEVIALRKDLGTTMAISRGGFRIRTHTLVRLTSDDGLTGLGEAVGNAAHARAVLEGSLGRTVLGLDPGEIEQVRHQLLESTVYYERSGSVVAAASALEMACWDLRGKALGQPVHALLGGRFRDSLEAYASDVYWQEDAAAMARVAAGICDRGFRAVKVHVGRGTPREDAVRLRAVRQAIGPDLPLMVDLNAGYDLPAAKDAVHRWADLDLDWIEEPLHPDHVDAQAELRAHSPVPIAAGENVFRLHGFQNLFAAGAADVAMPDIGRAGGLWEARAICFLADAHGIPVSPHNFSSGVLLAATMHLMAAAPNCRLLEMDTSGNAVYEELLLEPLVLAGGRVQVPTAPGLGVHLPAAVLDRHADSLSILE
jgi:L-alanine-DL-glutamate epimerase-like enolase superfamily enzyme